MDDCEAAFYRPNEDAMVQENVRAGTIIVDEQASQTRPIGSINNTIVHECLHWHRHRKAYYLARLIAGRQPISCLVDGGMAGGVTDRLPGIEWQANALAPKIQMPYPAFKRKTWELIRLQRQDSPDKPLVDLLPPVIAELADLFGVSKLAVKIRLLEVGYPEARGVLDYVDGRYLRPYAFAPGALEKNQTFTISAVELAQLYDESEELRERLQSGEYTVVESHVCLNDPRYVFGLGGGMPMLTEYARLHVDECCLKFAAVWGGTKDEWKSLNLDVVMCRIDALQVRLRLVEKAISSPTRKGETEKVWSPLKGAYSGAETETKDNIVNIMTKFASKEDNTSGNNKNDIVDDIVEEIVVHIQLISEKLKELHSFKPALDNLRRWRGLTQEKLSEKSDVSLRKLQDCLSPKSKNSIQLDTVVYLCIGLQLPYELSRRLIELAGFALTVSPKHLAYDFVLRSYSSYNIFECKKLIASIEQGLSDKREIEENSKNKSANFER